ncbi:MAG: glycosyltransferase family 39 protein [Gemmatales bacterium]
MSADAPVQTVNRSANQIGWGGTALILLFGITMLIGYHMSGRSLTMHEVIFAQPAREMLASGDWLVPRVAGVVFPDKPLLTMWLMMVSITVTGSEAEWAVRLPSSLAALLTALIIAATAARWFGRRIGILAGLIQLTSYYVLQMATLAESDMLLICSVTAALCFFAWVKIESPVGRIQGRWTPWFFLFLVGMAFMIKGPLGVIFIGLTCAAYMMLTREWLLLQFFFHPGGLLVFAIMALPYPFLSGLRYPPILDDWMLHNWGRFRGELSEMRSTEPLLFYFYNLPMVLLPWFPCLLIALWDREIWKKPIVWLSLLWCLMGLGFLSFSAWKWRHYMSPALPGMTILLAIGLDRWLYSLSTVMQRAWRPLMALSVVMGVTGWVIVQRANPIGAQPIMVMIAVGTVCALVVLELSYRRAYRLSVPALFVMIWAMVVGVFGYVLPAHDHCRIQVEFADRINHRADLDQPLHLVSMSYDQIIYYLKKPIVRMDKMDQFIARTKQAQGSTLVLIRQMDLGRIQHLGTLEQIDYCPNLRRTASPGEALVLLKLNPVTQAGYTEEQ